MSEPGARLGDATSHDGSIGTGDGEVLVCGQPAARGGDAVECPEHGLGRIIEFSKTVFWGGANAARQTSKCACSTTSQTADGRPAVAGPGTKTTVLFSADPKGRTEKEQLEQAHGRSAHAELGQTDIDGDGVYDSHEVKGSLGKIQFGDSDNGLTMDIGGVRAKGISNFNVAEADAFNAHLVEAEAQLKSPYVAVSGRGSMFGVDAKKYLYFVNSDKVSGFGAGAEGAAGVFEGEAAISASPRIGDWIMNSSSFQWAISHLSAEGAKMARYVASCYNADLTIKVSGAVGPSAGAGVAGAFDHDSGRLRGKIMGKIIGGAEIDYGACGSDQFRAPKPPASAPADGEVAKGANTVLVGE